MHWPDNVLLRRQPVQFEVTGSHGELTVGGRLNVHAHDPAGGFLAFRFFPAIASTSKPKPASLSR